MNNFKHLAFVIFSVSVLVASFGSVGNCWQPTNPVMGPNIAPMGPPMQGAPMCPSMQGTPMCPPMPVCRPMQPPSACCPGIPMEMMPCRSKLKILGPLTLSAGYVGTFNNSGFRREVSSSNPAAAFPSYEFRAPTKGVWLGASQTFYVCPKCGLVGSGGILAPSKTHGTIVQQGVADVSSPNSDIDIKNQWGRADAAAFCEVFRSRNCKFGFLALGGFRWDHFEQKADGTAVDAAGASLGNFKDDLTVDSYLPYLGGQFSLYSCKSSANVRFIVSPGLWGDLKLDNTNLPLSGAGHVKAPLQWGNFWELYAVYTLSPFKWAEAGAYFDWTFLELVSETRSNTFVSTSPAALAALLPTTLSNPERIHVDRNSWSVGGTLKFSFDLGI
jgi:hypothetical protein